MTSYSSLLAMQKTKKTLTSYVQQARFLFRYHICCWIWVASFIMFMYSRLLLISVLGWS